MPDFLLLLEAITGRASELVTALVPLDTVPAVQQMHHNRQAAKAIAFDEPWSAAILRLLETEAYQRLPRHLDGWAAEILGIAVETEQRALNKMLATGVIQFGETHYSSGAGLTIDARADSATFVAFKDHWMQAMRLRAQHPQESDLFSFNLMSLSETDYETARALMVATFREIRSLAAASAPAETTALLQMQLMQWSPCKR